jgi:hypothetical protein
MQPIKLSPNGATAVAPTPLIQSEEQPLQDKVSLIVGGDSESGRSLVMALAKKGSHIVVVCLHDLRETTRQLQQQVEATNRHCLLITGDPTSRGFAQRAMKQILATFGRLDLFIDYSPQSDDASHKQSPVFPNLAMMTAALEQMAAKS